MKWLFFLSLALLFLSSKVSSRSQNQNMFDFEMFCYDYLSPACHVMDVYERAGQIISNNLELISKIQVGVRVTRNAGMEFWAYARPFQILYKNDTYYPSALIKQLDCRFNHTEKDIIIEVNSNFDNQITHFKNDWIEQNRIDFAELILHELQHGLGIVSTWYYLDKSDLFPSINYTTNDDGKMIFQHIKENVFDKYLVTTNGTHISPYLKDLNNMAGPSGKTYDKLDALYNHLRKKQEEEDQSYTRDMLILATQPKGLAFSPKAYDEKIILYTSYPFISGRHIIHLDNSTYSKTPDFLFTPTVDYAKKLEEKVEAYGNHPGEGMGPCLMMMLESIGYRLRITEQLKCARH